MVKSLRFPICLALPLAALAGCGTQTLVAGLLVGLPQVTWQPPATGQVTPGPQKFGPYTLLTGAVFTIDTSNPAKLQDAKITAVSGVNASINYRSCSALTGQALADCLGGSGGADRVFRVNDQGAGLYSLTNQDAGAAAFGFETGVRYTLVLEVPQDETARSSSSTTSGDWEAFGAGFKPGPAAVVSNFATSRQIHNQQGQDLTLTRSDLQVDGEYLPAIVLVGLLDTGNTSSVPTITYTSLDYQDPKELLLLALSDQKYRVGTFTIPGAKAFAKPGTYLVALLSIAEGKASANAFLGSTALAASGDAGIVVVP
jgi:hypothetical protein